MVHVLGCIAEQHDLRLVALAAALCLFACITATSMMVRGREARTLRVRHLWILTAALVAGSGIWATHFVTMLAFQSGVPLSFDPLITIVSVVTAIVLCGAGFETAFRHHVAGGVITGIAIAAMHYIGMAAIRAPAEAIWDYRYVAASALLGIATMALGMRVMMRREVATWNVSAALIFVFAIVTMHFTGMAAFALRPDPVATIPNAVLDPGTLAVAVSGVAALIVSLGLYGALFDRHLALRTTEEADRLRNYVSRLEATKEELERTSEELRTALVRADAGNRTKARFLANMSHELRTPLNAVLGFSDFVLSEPFGPLGSERYKDYIKDIHQGGSHLLSLVNDVLDLSRLDANQVELRDETVEIAALFHDALNLVSPQAAQGGIAIAVELPTGLPAIQVDRRRLCQAIVNLLMNAVKFTPPGGRVTLSANHCGGELGIAIADTGIGIAEKDIPKAFERFGQVDSRLARKYQGSGLGLPLARQLAELHGGRFELQSKEGVGTTVTITLPKERIVVPEVVPAAIAA
ncbi:MAG TPA: MHYT domain-containing protein [Rhizomicrobium sp.]|nr:MHYT domain-containing protein [Rhizomicrobium sp.]